MSVVTSIKPQKNPFGKLRAGRVNIYLDGKFGFGLDLETFIKSGLKIEQELTKEEVEKIVRKGEFQKTYEKLLRFVSLRPRSEKEIKDYFRRKKVHESMTGELLKRIKRLQFLDDRKFAVWWIQSRQSFRPKSKRILEQELRVKGINRELVKEILSEQEVDDYKNAKKVLDKKKYRWEKLDPDERIKKESEFLLRQGFGWDIVRKVTNIDG